MKESDLYAPLKAYLEGQGYQVKGEVGHCDVVATRDNEPPLVVELKLNLNIEVMLQLVDRFAITPSVYVGIPNRDGRFRRSRRRVIKLMRRLGAGLILIDPAASSVSVIVDPTPYQPRISNRRRQRLLKEFEDRVGDPNEGGVASRRGITTAFRQRAIVLARLLLEKGPMRAAVVAETTGIANARDIMYRNVYGWFDRRGKGVYELSTRGKREIEAL